jgi:hypothetical protein
MMGRGAQRAQQNVDEGAIESDEEQLK